MKPDRPNISFEEYENTETFVEKYKRRIRQNPFLSVGKFIAVSLITFLNLEFLYCSAVLLS